MAFLRSTAQLCEGRLPGWGIRSRAAIFAGLWRAVQVGLACWLLGSGAPLGAQVSREYDLKAAFLFKFAQFVEWPPQAFPEAATPIVIGVLGADPFGEKLDQTVKNERLYHRKLIVNRYRQVEEIQTCHILFISRSEAGRLEQILARLKGRPILTVCDQENFIRRGGMIGFVTEQNKIRLEINEDAAQAAHLTLSSKLLRVAQVVSGSKKR